MPPKKATKSTREAAPADAKGEKKLKKEASAGTDDEKPLSRRASSNTVTEEQISVGTVPFVRKTKDTDFKGSKMLKVVSWNVAGLRALLKTTELETLFKNEAPDVVCLQEVKIGDEKEAGEFGEVSGYTFVDSVCTVKKGYSGTRTYVKDGINHEHVHFSLSTKKGSKPDEEGRVLTTHLQDQNIYIVNTYIPNSGMKLERLEYRVESYDPKVRAYLAELSALGDVVWTGDLNVAERDYDRFFNTWKSMIKCPGFTPEERASFRQTLSEVGLVDSFRELYPTAKGAGTYTFWSKMFAQRPKGNGWRLDYFVVSKALQSRVVDVFPDESFNQSDHIPVLLWLQK